MHEQRGKGPASFVGFINYQYILKHYYFSSMLLLERENAHPRDSRISFNEAEHYYTVDSRRVVGSVSGLWASCFSRFDAPNTARRMVERWSSRDAPSGAPDDRNWRWRYAYAWETLVNKTPPAFAMERLEKSGCLSFDFMEDDKGYCRVFLRVLSNKLFIYV
jgi:hypothetical protein